MDREDFRRELGRRLASGRKYRGLSQPELAEVTGLKKSSISRWERGESPIDVEALLALAQALEVGIAELLAYDGDGGDPDRPTVAWPTRASANGQPQHQAA
jgi:transcriptional regulator with XRE-family HTH domain